MVALEFRVAGELYDPSRELMCLGLGTCQGGLVQVVKDPAPSVCILLHGPIPPQADQRQVHLGRVRQLPADVTAEHVV